MSAQTTCIYYMWPILQAIYSCNLLLHQDEIGIILQMTALTTYGQWYKQLTA
jgi:hypothetical protein